MPNLNELWDMLIVRCPTLETLSLDGHWFPTPTSFPRLSQGRWRNLRTLNLGEVVVNWEEATHTEAPELDTKQRPFIQFLEMHPTLQHLNLIGMIHSTVSFEPLSSDALPELLSFSGNLTQITRLPSPGSVRTIRIPTATFGSHIIREHKLFATFQAMVNLRVLELHVVLHPDLPCDGMFIQELVQSCPRLESLDFSCVRFPNVTFVSLLVTDESSLIDGGRSLDPSR